MARHSRRFLSALSCSLGLSLLIGGCPVDGASGPVGDPTGDSQLPARPLIRDDDHVKAVGAPSVTVVEYGDFECPICGRFFRETYPTIVSEYIETGKVRWVFRHFPLAQIHPNAQRAAEASECASAAGSFWAYHDWLFANQDDLSNSALVEYAASAGLDGTAFATCLGSGDSAVRVQVDVDSGRTYSVTGTPTFFVNDTRVVGFRTVAEFRAILDKAIADAE